jgi:hypothetical protein
MSLRNITPEKIPAPKATKSTTRKTATTTESSRRDSSTREASTREASTREASPVLDVKLIAQEQTQWCWAACTQMVVKFLLNKDVKQCELANFLHEQTKCCSSPSSSGCNQPCPFEKIIPVFNKAGINGIFEGLPSAWSTIVREIKAGRPLEVGYLWFGGGGHVAILYGFGPNNMLMIHDPWYGSATLTYRAVLSAYGMGRWSLTYGRFVTK